MAVIVCSTLIYKGLFFLFLRTPYRGPAQKTAAAAQKTADNTIDIRQLAVYYRDSKTGGQKNEHLNRLAFRTKRLRGSD